MLEYAANVHSQNGEDGIIAEILRRIPSKDYKKHAVEFGGADGYYCSNTAALRDNGWHVTMYDLMAYPPHVEQRTITPENVNDLPYCAVLSIDVDGNDYNIWKAYDGKPIIVIIEINSSVSPYAMTPVSDPRDGTGFKPMVELAIDKGYFLMAHTGNCIFVRNDYRKLFPEADKAMFKEDWLTPPTHRP